MNCRLEIVIAVLQNNVSTLDVGIRFIPGGILTLKGLSGTGAVPSPTFKSHFAKSSACACSAGCIWLARANNLIFVDNRSTQISFQKAENGKVAATICA